MIIQQEVMKTMAVKRVQETKMQATMMKDGSTTSNNDERLKSLLAL